MKIAVSLMSVAVLAAGCATESRAMQVRDSLRVQRGGTWDEQWADAQSADLNRAGRRLELCFDYLSRGDALVSAVPRAEVDAICGADVRQLEIAEGTGPTVYGLAVRWAREVLHDERLAGALVCSGARHLPNSPGLNLQCADQLITANRWSAALTMLNVVFEHGSEAEQCEVVRRIDRFSPASAADTSELAPERVRACRVAMARSGEPATPLPTRPTSNPPRVANSTPPSPAPAPTAAPAPALGSPASTPAVTPTPSTSNQAPAHQEWSAAAERPVAPQLDEAPIEGGLQVNGTLGAGSSGAVVSTEIGYGASTYAIGFAPWAVIGTAPGVTVGGLGVATVARVYLAERRARLLVGYVRPELSFGAIAASADFSVVAASFTLGCGIGVEYLLDRHFGVSADLSLKLALAPTVAIGTAASIGIVLHQ